MQPQNKSTKKTQQQISPFNQQCRQWVNLHLNEKSTYECFSQPKLFQSSEQKKCGRIVSSICLRAAGYALTAHTHFPTIVYPVPKHPARVLLFRPTTDREDIDDENISVTRTNSTSLSRCSSTYRSRSRSPPHHDEEGVLNLDTKSSKITLADDSSAFEDVKQKSPSEHQSRLEEVYQSSVDHQSTAKQKSRKFSSADDVEPPMAHEENGSDKGFNLLKNTKVRRNTHKDDVVVEPLEAREKPPLFPHNYIPRNLDLLKFQTPTANFPLPFPIPEAARLYTSPYFYHLQPPAGSDPTIPLFSNNFINYPHHPLFFPDAYRKEQPKPTSPSRTSPPKVSSQSYPGSRVEPVLPNQTSIAPIH